MRMQSEGHLLEQSRCKMSLLYNCSLCDHFSATSIGGVLRHIGAVHAYEPHFHLVCGIKGCPRTYKNYHSFRKHLRRRHAECLDHSAESGPDFGMSLEVTDGCSVDSAEQVLADNGDSTEEVGFGCSAPCIQSAMDVEESLGLRRNTAMFLIKTKEVNGVSQAALNELVEDVTLMVQRTADAIKLNVEHVLTRKGIRCEEIEGLNEVFQMEWIRNPFSGIHSEFLQHKVYKELFGLVEPVARKLGATLKRKVKKSRSQYILCGEFVYDVPLLLSLQQLLSNEFIFNEVMCGHKRRDGLIGDYCDASACCTHPLFSIQPRALQIMLYYDDVEVCNPIGSRAKIHKLGIFYYLLGNISPEYRSTTKAIQLLAVVKHSVLKTYGIDRVLQPFMDDIRTLEQDAGVDFNLHGNVYNFRGTISLVSADNLAAWDLGGYKALASALRKCQFCMAVSTDMMSKFTSECFKPRTRQTHARHCQGLNGPLHDHMSVTYGVQRDSILNNSKYFHVTEGLSPDIMHDVLEGCLQYETKELLKYLIIEEKLFTLDHLNNRIEFFPYFYFDATDKPVAVAMNSLLSSDHSLKQSASQMWCFARLLPLMIGELVPPQDPKWENFILMLTITGYLFAPVTSAEIVPYLKVLIEEHHEAFCVLYSGSSIIPKMHYVIHLPDWLLRCGPASRYQCIRFEAKHSYFKSLSHKVKCFKNICKTLADRHQTMMCYYLAGNPDKFYKETAFGQVRQHVNFSQYSYKHYLAKIIPHINDDEELCSVSWASVRGTMYKRGAVVVLKNMLLPEFGLITDIIVYDVDCCLFVCHMLITNCYAPHFHSFEVKLSEPSVIEVVKQTALADYHPLGLYSLSSHSYVSFKYHIMEY